MGGKSPNSVWWSIQSTKEEREVVKRAARRAGMRVNTFIRQWIARLADEERERGDG